MAPKGPRRSPRKSTKSKTRKVEKKSEPPLPSIKWTADGGALIWALIAQLEVKENRLVLFGKENKGENTSGDSKIAVYKRIGSEIMPEIFKVSPNALGKRVKGKAEDLVSTYKTEAKKLQVTGGGLRNDDEDANDENGEDSEENVHEYLDCYITPEGPDHDTTPRALNLWESITKKFKYFPALHRFLAARSNIVPPVVTTGIGPEGRKVLHLQPPGDANIDPALRKIVTETPRRSRSASLASSPIDIDSSPLVAESKTSRGKGKTKAAASSFQTAVSSAKAANESKYKPKKNFEETLVEIQT
ncbi:hypothetical protein DFH06DRAFT_1017570 [Mycena polygramma]|nr:hypothetical protein DFH06DRAFT_1017570 [Mycena polygramma]